MDLLTANIMHTSYNSEIPTQEWVLERQNYIRGSDVIISWIAYNNDFKEGQVATSGPTYSYHKHFYDEEAYDKHIMLAAESSENLRITKSK